MNNNCDKQIEIWIQEEFQRAIKWILWRNNSASMSPDRNSDLAGACNISGTRNKKWSRTK